MVEIYHNLTDVLDIINSTLLIHLIPTIISMLAIEIFGFYGIIRNFHATSHLTHEESHNNAGIFLICSNVGYIFIQFIMKILLVHVGTTTSAEIENTRCIIAKCINQLPQNNQMRFELCSALVQFQTRIKKLQNSLIVVDWNIVLAVECHMYFYDRFIYQSVYFSLQTISATITFLIIMQVYFNIN